MNTVRLLALVSYLQGELARVAVLAERRADHASIRAVADAAHEWATRCVSGREQRMAQRRIGLPFNASRRSEKERSGLDRRAARALSYPRDDILVKLCG